MNTNTNKNTKATKKKIEDKPQGERDINNNIAFYRQLKM